MSKVLGREFWDYVAAGVGMALACSGYAMLGEMSVLVSGPWLVLATLGGGLLCLVVASAISELAGMYPSAPGIRTYLRGAFGDQTSLALTFAVFAIVVLFAGVEAYFFASTLRSLWPAVPEVLATCLPIALVVGANLIGLDFPLRLQTVMTVVLVLALFGITGLALVRDLPPAAPTALPAFSGDALAGCIGTAVFLYTGFEWVTPLGRRPASYERRIPLSMIAALLVLIAMFLSVSLAMEAVRGSLPGGALGQAPHVQVGRVVAGTPGQLVMLAVSFLSMLTTFNAGLMGAARLFYAVGRERLLPRFATRIALDSGTPVGAVLAVGGSAAALSVVQLYLRIHVTVALVCAALYCIVYASFIVALFRLRRLQPAAARPFRSRVPRVLLGLVAVLLPVLGVFALTTDAAQRVPAVLGLVAVLAGCSLLARSRLRASRSATTGAEAPRAAAAELRPTFSQE
jgi:amino acid transporter